MKHFKHTILIITAALIAIASGACSSHKAATAITADNSEWHDITLPVKLSLKSPASFSLGGRATIVRDSVVYISFRVFGFEAAVLNATADSVFFVDKYHKYYFAESLDAVLGHYRKDIGIGRIQELLLGRSPLATDNMVTFGAASSMPVTIAYNDYEDACPGRLPQRVDISAAIKKMDVKATLGWTPSSARCNTYPQVRFRRPGNSYRRITISEAQQVFKNMTL